MRIWSVHPCYLDPKGLGAQWNEGLICRRTLERNAGGWLRHAQLDRFRDLDDAYFILTQYLQEIYEEARRRGYNYNPDLLPWPYSGPDMAGCVDVTTGQVQHELGLLRKRLDQRCPRHLTSWPHRKQPLVSRIFNLVPGSKAIWEKSVA